MPYPKGKKQSPESIIKRANALRGRKLTDEHKAKIGAANKLKIHPSHVGYQIGHVSFNKGKSFTEEHKKKISETQKGDKGHWWGKNAWNKGKPFLQIRREKHWNWKGGISESHQRTNSIEWNEIRKKVYARDNWTCQICGKKNPHPLQCHHIIPYRISQDDSIENLITLCCSCHIKEEHKYYNIKNGNN